VFYGQVFDDSIEDKLKVTVIATGFPAHISKLAGDKSPLAKKIPALASAPNPTAVQLPSEDLRRPAYLRIKNRKLK
jgi:cell division GTPase FtsZ